MAVVNGDAGLDGLGGRIYRIRQSGMDELVCEGPFGGGRRHLHYATCYLYMYEANTYGPNDESCAESWFWFWRWTKKCSRYTVKSSLWRSSAPGRLTVATLLVRPMIHVLLKLTNSSKESGVIDGPVSSSPITLSICYMYVPTSTGRGCLQCETCGTPSSL